MKFRLTPLNLITALGVALLVVSFFHNRPAGGLANITMGPFYKVILSILILVTAVIDLIFRFILKSLKRVWLVELFFIGFTVILFLILHN